MLGSHVGEFETGSRDCLERSRLGLLSKAMLVPAAFRDADFVHVQERELTHIFLSQGAKSLNAVWHHP